MVRHYGVVFVFATALATTNLACQADGEAKAPEESEPKTESEPTRPPSGDSIGVPATSLGNQPAAAAGQPRPGIKVTVNGGAALVLADIPATWAVAATTADGSSRKLAIVSVASRGLSSATAQSVGVASTSVTVQRDAAATTGALIVNVRDMTACEPVHGAACANTAVALADVDVAHEAAWSTAQGASGNGDAAALGIGIAVMAIDLFANGGDQGGGTLEDDEYDYEDDFYEECPEDASTTY